MGFLESVRQEQQVVPSGPGQEWALLRQRAREHRVPERGDRASQAVAGRCDLRRSRSGRPTFLRRWGPNSAPHPFAALGPQEVSCQTPLL